MAGCRLRRVTLFGAATNVILAATKITVGVVAASHALVADGIHSLSDLVADFTVYWGVRAAGRPPDADHSYGHGRFETLAALFVGVLLLLAGASFAWHAATTVVSALRGAPLAVPGGAAIWVALVSVVAKEALCRVTMRVARKSGSPAVSASAWHHRADALSSVTALLGIAAARMLGRSWALLDPAAAVLVAGAVLWIGLRTVWQAAREMTDEGLSPDEQARIYDEILRVPGVSDPHDLRTRRLGSSVALEVHIRVDSNTTVRRAHDLASEVERRLRVAFGRETQVTTHIEPKRE